MVDNPLDEEKAAFIQAIRKGSPVPLDAVKDETLGALYNHLRANLTASPQGGASGTLTRIFSVTTDLDAIREQTAASGEDYIRLKRHLFQSAQSVYDSRRATATAR